MITHTIRWQRTIAATAEINGYGFLTGADVTVRFVPAPPSSGISFVRTDLQPQVVIPASVEQITATDRRTTLGKMPHCVTLCEHVLAALAGLHIDNCIVELNAIEPPGLDGSARDFVNLLHSAGIESQPVPRQVWAVDKPITVTQAGATLTLHPARENGFRVSYLLDYGPQSPIVPQRRTCTVLPQTFANDIARCRTYLLDKEAAVLRSQGIGENTRLSDVIVFGPNGPIDNHLRYADEPARHKILDIIGDLSLLGCDLRGHVVGYRSGHALNAALAREINHQMRQQFAARLQAA